MDVNTYFKRAALLEHVRQHLLDECELTLNVFCGKCNHGEASAKDFRTFNSIDVCDEAGRMVRLGWSYRDGMLLCPECSKGEGRGMSGDDERLRAEYTQETRQLPPGVAECSPGDELNHACREGMREAAFERWKAAAELAQRHWNIKEDE